MGRHAKSAEYHVINGNASHLTKEELEDRKKNQIKIGDAKLKLPDLIKNNVEALKKWKELKKLFTETDLITSADIGAITRYCILWAEYIDLINHRKKHVLPDTTDLFGGVIVVDNKTLSEIEGMISKKCAALSGLEDRLFLNSIARVKNIPKKEQKKFMDPLEQKGFANV